MLLKRASRGQLLLMSAAQAAVAGIMGEPARSSAADEESRLVQAAKRIALFTLGIAYQRYAAKLEKEQEIVMNISDIIMEVFAMESSLLRSRKLAASGNQNVVDVCAVFLREAMHRIEVSSETVIGTCSTPNTVHDNVAALRRLAFCNPLDAIALRRNIAGRLLASGCYRV